MATNKTPIERFTEKIQISDSGCWEWARSTDRDGYAAFKDGRSWRGHIWAYEFYVGPVPDNLQLDHTCRNRKCVNPSHLEPVTGIVNILRGEGVGSLNARKTHCCRGHLFDEANTRWFTQRNGTGVGRECIACKPLRRKS